MAKLKTRYPLVLCGAILLVSAVIRFYRLDYHSLWFDEAVSVRWAWLGPATIMDVSMKLVEDKLPPLYYLMLHYWTRVFGSSEVAVRSLSALLGVLYLLPLYGLGAALFNRRTGLIAALLAAVNPFLVWYSQETRMYAAVALFSLAATYCFLRALRANGRAEFGWWAGYVVLTVSGIYTHQFAAFIVPFQAVYFGLCWLADGQRPAVSGQQPATGKWWRVGLALAAVALGFLPLALNAWRVSGETGPGQPFANLGHQLQTLVMAFTLFRVPWDGRVVWAVLAGATALLLWGLLAPAPRRKAAGAIPDDRPAGPAQGRLFLACYLLVPFVVVNLLLWRDRLLIYDVRYFIVLVAPFVLLVAAGVDGVLRRASVAGVLVLLALTGVTLAALRYDWSPRYRREDWRSAARYVIEHQRVSDAVLVYVDFAQIPFKYYYNRRTGGILPFFVPFGGPVDEATMERTLSGLAEFDTVWLVQSHLETADPAGSLQGWFDARYPLVTEQYPAGIVLRAYALNFRRSAPPDTMRPLDAVFDGRVRLLGYEMDGPRFHAADDTFHPPSGWVHVTLYWQALEPLAEDYRPIVRVVDGAGRIWGDKLERGNGVLDFYPATRWQPGEIIRDEWDVNLNPATPPGEYTLELGLLSASGQQLPVVYRGQESGHVLVGQVQIVP